MTAVSLWSKAPPVHLSSASPIEREALVARLRALGVEGELNAGAPLTKEQFAKAQITLADLARVAGGAPLTLDRLETLDHSRRFLGRQQKIELGKPGEAAIAKNTVRDQLNQLGHANTKLASLARNDAGQRGADLGALVSLLKSIDGGLAQLRTPGVAGHLAKAELDQLASGHLELSTRMSAALATMADSFVDLEAVRTQRANLAEMITIYANVIEKAPLFREGEGRADATVGVPELEARLRGREEKAEAADVAAKEAIAKLQAQQQEVERVDGLLGRVAPLVEGRGDPVRRKVLLTELFGAFRPETEATAQKWTDALGKLSVAELERDQPALLAVARMPRLDDDGRTLAANLATKLPVEQCGAALERLRAQAEGDGKLAIAEALAAAPRRAGAASGVMTPALLDRVGAFEALMAAHLQRRDPPLDYRAPNLARLQAIAVEVRKLSGQVKTLEAEHRQARGQRDEEKKGKLESLPGYKEYLAFDQKKKSLDREIHRLEYNRGVAEENIDRWNRNKERDAWRENHGVTAYFHAQNRELCEVQCPAAIREATRKLPGLYEQRGELKGEVARWEKFEKEQVAPIVAEYEARSRAADAEYNKASGEARDRRARILGEAGQLARDAFDAAGMQWVNRNQAFYPRSSNRSFEQTFSKIHYREEWASATQFLDVIRKQASQCAADHGVFDLDARASRAEALGHLETNLDRIEQRTKNDALGKALQEFLRMRTVWDEVTRAHNQVMSAAD